MLRAVLLASLFAGLWGCIPGGGGGGGGDEDGGAVVDGAITPDLGVDPDDGVLPDRGVDPDDGVLPDRGVDPDDGVEADRGVALDRGVEADDGVELDRGVEVDDGVEADEGVSPDQGGGECVEGRVESRPCGLNGRGTATRVCADGRWSPWGCEDVDACVDATVEVRPCAGGEERRSCLDGQWSAWGICRPPPVCEAGEREMRACGLNQRGEETRVCGDGQWGPWGMCLDDDVCTDGARQQEDCGLNGRGVRARSCVAGQWGAFGQCDDPDLCVDGTEEGRACGLNGRGRQTRRCAAGRWGAYGQCNDPDVCVDGAEESRACGLNGRGEESRRCAAGRWGAYGACEDADMCVDGAVVVEPCPAGGDGQRVCAGGQFGALEGCAGDVLCPAPAVLQLGVPVEGVTAGASRTTGTCGQGRGSEVTWRFTAPRAGRYRFTTAGSGFDTALYVRADCEDRASELGCNDDGAGNTHSQLDLPLAAQQAVTVFVDGYYAADDAQGRGQGPYLLLVSDLSECDDGDVDERGCLADRGVEERTCRQGTWGAWSACQCMPGSDFEEICGRNGRGTRTYACVGGVFPNNPVCDDPDVCVDGTVVEEACAAGGGLREDTCVEGQYEEGPCLDPVCPPLEVAVLGEQRGATPVRPSQLAGTCGTSGVSAEVTYAFTAPEAGDYTFDTSGSAFDTVLHLREDCGDAASEIECDDDDGEGTRSKITVALAAEQTVVVVVDGYNGRAGEYVLSIARGDLAWCVERDGEPNDTTDDATLMAGVAASGYSGVGAACDGNVDYWRFAVEADCVVTAEMTVDAGMVPLLSLVGPDGEVVDEVGEAPVVVTGASMLAGDWWLRVEPQAGEVHYRLDATVECPAPAP